MLRIALVHSFYASGQPSGENEAVRDQARALRAAGHEAVLVSASTDELQGSRLYPLRAAARVATGHGSSPLARLHELAPDVVHVHNLFPNFGRAWVRRWRGPLVATLHNYRPLCAAATLYREGAACTSCPDGDRWAGLRQGCYRGSRAATAPLAWAGRAGAAGDPLLARADRLVMLSPLSRDTYVRAGVPRGRTALVPNFAELPRPAPAAAGDRWVFAGRLTREKGIAELLRIWPSDVGLDVVGDGELAAECRAVAPPSVAFHGSLDRVELRARLASWRGLVFPSRWREAAPLVYVEALAAGLPVLAFDGSSVADAVRAGGTGRVVDWDQPLGPVLKEAAESFPGLRPHCRAVYEAEFTREIWARRMTALYESVL
ncbi:glycosyltransferase family 4 protein [Streptomyces sp. NPDC001941]|uniref:glycosyltransferase family 4 protein n=1 Tax=Streptomyces sp. NPDC001941 TaxID=3154659 RepID=UPI003328B3AE